MEYIIEIKMTKLFVDILIGLGVIAFLYFGYFIVPRLVIGNFRPRLIGYIHNKKLKHVRDIYGDEILRVNARSEWVDKKGNTFYCTSLGYPSTIHTKADNGDPFDPEQFRVDAIQWTGVNAGNINDFYNNHAAKDSKGNIALRKQPFWIYGRTIELYLGDMKKIPEAQHVPIGHYLILAQYPNADTIVCSSAEFERDFWNKTKK